MIMVEADEYAREAALQYAALSDGGAMGGNPREVGSVLEGKYEIVRPLGTGGMGEVYLVRHVHLQELRVVKILRHDLATDASAQARFLREARLATQIKHPNVAILYDYSRLADGSFYMVWEYIEGQDVGDRLRQQGPFPVPVALQLGIQSLRGLEAIHSTGVIHRDLSPDNLMITEDRRGQLRMKIIDLGLAKDLGPSPNFEITKVGTFMGKLQYCSPEQAGPSAGEVGLDRRSDLYSLALVLYEMICGLPPFESESAHGFIFKRLSEDPLPLSGRNPSVAVPQELDRVMRRALDRDREQRYADAVSFILALEKVGHALSSVATQELQLPVRGEPRPPAGIPAKPRPRSSSEMTREERMELLAQIEKAAAKAREGDQLLARAEEAAATGRLADARALVRRAEATNQQLPGLEQVRRRIAAAESQERRNESVRETERALLSYIEKRQAPLARFALESLLELQPEHSRRRDYEARIAALATEIEGDLRISEALAEGRAALARGDFAAARHQVENLVKSGAPVERVAELKEEIAAGEREEREAIDFGARRRRIEALLESGKLADADREVADLARLDVPRVTIDAYRVRIDEAKRGRASATQGVELERRVREGLAAKNFVAAREAAFDLERQPNSGARGAELLAEVDRSEAAHRRQEALEQGVRQVESFLQKGDSDQAELALKILVQMDPENRQRKRLEKQVKALKGG